MNETKEDGLPQQPEPEATSASRPFESIYDERVGGWLLLFCVGLTIISPLMVLSSITSLTTTWNPNAALSLKIYVFSEMVANIYIAIFSCYAGVMLWSKKPGSVLLTKQYLILLTVFMLIDICMPTVLQIDYNLSSAIPQENWKSLFSVAVYVSIWYSYLNKSKRVEHLFRDIAYKGNYKMFYNVSAIIMVFVVIVYSAVAYDKLQNDKRHNQELAAAFQ